MISAAAVCTQQDNDGLMYPGLSRDTCANVLADIYDDPIYLAVWNRHLSASLKTIAAAFVKANPTYRLSVALTPDHAKESLHQSMGKLASPELCDDIAELVGMFCMLFGLESAGVRLNVLDNAMCPKFHVDRIPCRLVTTYHGAPTEWLPHDLVDRSKLGHGACGQLDHESGLFKRPQDIQQLHCGDVALLKGDLWDDNEGCGLVHRSPHTQESGRRLFLSLDFIN
jgi:hypothetical protein